MVYSWFEPSPEKLHELKEEGQKDSHFVKCNDDRWGLYYGVKHLAVDDPEASLFFTFLDEGKGEDYCAFALNCLQVVEGLGKQLLRTQFGPCTHSIEGSCQSMEILDSNVIKRGYTMDYEKKNDKANTDAGESGEGKDFYAAGGGQAIWVPARILCIAVRACLEAMDAEKLVEAIKRTNDMSVEATDR